MPGKLSKAFRIITSAVFFILVFLYCWYYINPALIYFKQQPIFLFDKYFLNKFLLFPGGIAEYLSLFISQFFYSKFAGSLLITGIIFIAVALTNRLLQHFFSKQAAFLLQFIPGLILVYLHSHYEYDLRGDFIFMVPLIFALAYCRTINHKVYFRILFLMLSSLILFFFFGGTALLLFTAIIFFTEIYNGSRRFFRITAIFQLLMCLILIRIVPLTSPYINFKMAYLGILCPGMYYKPLKFLYTLYISIPVLLLIRVIIKYAWEATGLAGRFTFSISDQVKKFLLPAIPIVMTGLLILIIRLSFSQTAKDSVLIHYYAAHGKWKSVLKTSNALSTTDRTVLFEINRALYHLGTLPDNAFSYAQYWGENGLILTSHYSHDVLMYCSDLYYDMGHIKESLHWAYEAETKSDQAPDVLKRIVTDNIILGDYAVAEKFLKILSKSVLHKKWAKHYLPYLHNETLIRQDALMNEKRRMMPDKDFYVSTQQPQSDLVNLLSQYPENRMALEYFMLYSLFTHDLSTVAVNINLLGKLNYKKIPTHIEEALLLVMTLNPDFPIDLGKYKISEKTKERFMGYSKILIANKSDRVAAQADLFQDYGNTYWYYIYYVSPITTKRKIYEKTN